MERIVLEVDDMTAKKWRTASSEFRAKLGRFIGEQLNKIMESNQGEDSIRFFDELRAEMAEKGLTQEMLDDILNGET